MAHRVGVSPHNENFVRYSEQIQHDSAVSYADLPVDIASHILSFAQEGGLSRVSRTWREENRPFLNRTIHQITFRDRHSQERVNQAREILARNNFTLVTFARDLLIHRMIQMARVEGIHPGVWEMFGHTFRLLSPLLLQENPDENLASRITFFERARSEVLDELRDEPANADRIGQLSQGLYAQLVDFVARENLALRFQRTIEDRGLDADEVPERCLHALHHKQREYARALGQENEHAFYPHPVADDFSYFHGVERGFLTDAFTRAQLDFSLHSLWYGPQRDLVAHPADSIRFRLLDPERDFTHFKHVWLENILVIPPEVARLPALELLSCYGPLRGLPEEMEECSELSRLFLHNTNFSELPSVLERLPALDLLSIENNQQPIRRISERLWNNLMGIGLNRTLMSWFEAQKICIIHNTNLDQVRELPFEMWFLNNFSIPYIPFPIRSFLRFDHPYEGGLDLVWRATLASALSLFNFPIFLINLIITMAIRPLVTAIRDELGYERMINLDNDE